MIFTSLGDVRYGAGGTFDTNGNQPNVRAAGDWGGIVLDAGAKASIDHAYIAYGGGQTPIEGSFDNFNVIETHQGDLRVAHSRIENNAAGTATTNRVGRGGNAAATIFARGAQPVIFGNDFRNNLGAVVSVNANSLSDVERPDPGRSTGAIDREGRYDYNRGPLVGDNRLSYTIDAAAGRPAGGATLGMEVRGEEVTVESVWDDVSIVHVLRNEVIVQNFSTATGVRLVSQPDASLIVKLQGANAGFTAAGYGLDITDRIGGTVQAIGQPGFPVVLTSLKDDSVGASLDPLGRPTNDTNGDGGASTAAPGDWRSLKFLSMSNDRNVSVVQESEKPLTGGLDMNYFPATAQPLGVLAPDEKSGDENRRLGFEIHGRVAADDTTDVDVYSFQAYAGSEVWLDVDKTSPALDSMIELLDASGKVLACSADSQTDGSLLAGTRGIGQDLQKDATLGGDYYTVNPKDSGMRVVLPSPNGQPVGTLAQYYVRVRSQPRYEPATTGADNGNVAETNKAAYEADLADPAKVKSGATSGAYELRVRLRQQDEKPGSTVRYADIRYPTVGIDVQGLPNHSPLTGTTGEATTANDTFATAQYVGNVLQSDQSTISVAGEISSATDVDWYSVALNLEQIQAISGVDGLKSWATVFDIDYADGFRGDLTLSVFDSNGNLIFVGRDSNVASDQPAAGQGTGFSDLSRGTAGKLDPFIGPAMLPAGLPTGGGSVESGTPVTPADPSKQLRYYVAVSSNQRLPTALDAYFNQAATNSKIRLEPIDSVRRIAEDHIGASGYKSGPQSPGFPLDVQPATQLFDTSSAEKLSLNVTPFTLSDVTLFVYTATTVETVDAMRGGSETVLKRLTTPPQNPSGDITMRSDGKLYQYVGSGNAGVLNALDTVTGAATLVGDDNIPVVPPAPAPAQGQETLKPAELGGTRSTFQLANSGLNRVTVNGTIRYTDTTGGVGGTPVTYSWSFTSDAAGKLAFTNVPTPAPPGGFAAPQNTTSTVTAGSVTGATVVNGVATINWSSAIDMTKVDMSIQYTYSTLAPIDNNAITTDSVDALTFVRVPGQATSYQLYYSVREGGQSRLYQGNVSTGDAAASRVGTGVIGGGSLGIVTGMAAVGGTMYGVDTNGNFFRFFPDGKGGQTTGTSILATVPGVQFQGLTAGPQNLQNGAFANMLFAIDSNGDLRAFDAATGTLQAVFDSNGDGVADATSIASGATGSGVLGLAFSPLDVNLWHPTTKRGLDAGHGTNVAPDNTRNTADSTDPDLQRELVDGQGNSRKFSDAQGGASMYFGLEQYTKPQGTNLTPYFNYQSYDGQYGVQDGNWQKDLTSQAGVGGTYNLPGGAYGSLVTNAFSLSGSTYNDKPALYFTYFLQTEKAASDYNQNDMRDSARVFIQVDGGEWQVVATNNSTRSTVYTSLGELPNFVSASSAIANIPNQRVQELYDTSEWRQARIDLGNWAGSSNVKLRFDFSTAGEFDPTQRDASGNLLNDIAGYAGTTGRVSGDVNSGAQTRGAKNNFEGFYVDDVIIGYAGRGEMVTGATPAQTGFFDIATPAAKDPTIAEQSLTGSYQLEIRRGTATGVQPVRNLPDVAIVPALQFDSNANLSGADAGDTNTVRDQGEFLIENNMILAAATYGISIDAATRDPYTNAPVPGTPRNLPVLNKNGLVPGAVIANNVISTSGTAGILFSGDAGGGTGPAAAAPFGRIVNNTIYGGKNYAAGVSLAATTVSGQPTVTVPATSGVRVGMGVTGIGIPAGTKVLSIDSGTGITLSQSATAAGTGVSLAFAFTTVGVAVTDNAAPTLLNNLIANVATGISVDASSQSAGAGDGRTVIGIEAYYNVGTQVTAGVSQSQPVVLDTDPFVNAAAGNFYLNAGSRAIDSSLNSLVDRAGFVAVKSAVGIPASPILAPDRDFYNQLRVDDPTQASLPGLGSNVFKDLGAIDRADVWQPYLTLLQPLDGSQTPPVDRDPLPDAILLAKEDARGVLQFILQLADNGVGIDPATVVKGAFTLTRNGVPLTEGSDYFFRYFPNNNRVVFEAPSVFVVGSYVIAATTRATAGGNAGLLADLANNTLLPNHVDGKTSFSIELADAPSAPTGVVGTPSEGQVALSWLPPISTGSSAITDYDVEYSTDGGTTWTPYTDGVATATTAVVSGLANDTAYVFHVRAKNAIGDGNWSLQSAPVTPQALPPAAPTGLTGVLGNGSVSLSWVAPSPGTSPITDYEVEYSSDGGSTWTSFSDGVSTGTTATVSPLSNGTAYVFHVRAVNKNGPSEWSAQSAAVTPLAPASAPLVTSVLAGNSQATVSWLTPADNGSAITGYVIQSSSNGGSTWTTTNVGAVNSALVTGLVNGTAYVFQVAAVTDYGTGIFSTVTDPATPLGPSAAPAVTSVVAGDSQATVSWSTPASNGSEITGYTVEYTSNGGGTWTPTSVGVVNTTVVAGLTNGTTYSFRVAAVTGFGTGVYSTPTALVRPLGPAASPAVTSVIAGDAQVSLSWATPAGNGLPITGYVLQTSANGGSSWTTTTLGAVNSTVVSGLVNGGSYIFQLAAKTDYGTGTFSTPTAAVTPLGLPGTPTALAVTGGDRSATLSWTAPVNDGGRPLIDYVVQYRPANSSTWLTLPHAPSTATSATISGLTNGTPYVFRVAAVTSFGQSNGFTPDSAPVTPQSVADAPTRPSATATNGVVTLVWTAPRSKPGVVITDYRVQYSINSGATWTTVNDGVSTNARATLYGLPLGKTYIFRVAAISGGGVGADSLSTRAVVVYSRTALPAAPTAVVGTGFGGTVNLSWNASPANDGGPVSDYVIQYRLASSSRWLTYNDGVSSTSSATIRRLMAGQNYVFRVAAKNLAGQGLFSAESAAIRA